MFRIFLLFLILFFGGCKRYHDILSTENIKERGIQATKKGEIIGAQETKLIYTATYMKMLDPKKYSGEFIFGIYVLDAGSTGLDDKRLKLLMDQKEPQEVTKIDDKEMLKDIPLYNPWSTYYMVNAQKSDAKKIKIELIMDGLGNSFVEFDKI